MFASIATLFAITVDRYVYIVKPLRYPHIVTHRRMFLAVSGIWITACCLFIVHYIHRRSFGVGFRGVCYIPNIIGAFTYTFVGYLPIALIFSLNFRILSVVRRHRKRIFAEDTTIASVDNSAEKSTTSISLLLRFFVALKSAKTFAIIVPVLTFRNLIPTVFGPVIYYLCTGRCKQILFFTMNFTE